MLGHLWIPRANMPDVYVRDVKTLRGVYKLWAKCAEGVRV
jgi:hypothetical protein